MRDTNQRLKVNGRTLAYICVLILLVVLGGCESTGAGGSDDGSESNLSETDGSDDGSESNLSETDGSDDGSESNLSETDGSESPGEALVLPEGNISGWSLASLGTRDDVVVLLMDSNPEVVKGYGPVTVQDNGDFPGMSIEPPPSEALLSWAEFQWVYCYELHNMPVSITDDSVRFQSFCCLELVYSDELILRGSGDGTAEVSWIYADGSTAITAVFDSGDYHVTVDLQLAAGWNRAVFQNDDINKVVTLKTESEPAGTGWYLE